MNELDFLNAVNLLGQRIDGVNLIKLGLMSPGGLGGIVYLLRDQFTTARAAGAVNNTTAEPTGQTRTVTDTNNKLTVTGGLLDLATGGAAIADPGLWYPSMTLRVGQAFIATISNTGVGPSEGYFGWFTVAGSTVSNTLFFIANQVRWNASLIIDAYVSGTVYKVAVIQRSAGAWLFIKNGTFTNWTLVWISTTGSGTFPGVIAGGTGTIATADDIKIPLNLIIISPLAYDTFTRADGALGSTETVGPDSQGLSALAWVFSVGIWAIATNKAVATPALGAELIVNGNFAAGTDWTLGAGWAIGTGTLNGVATTADASQTVAPMTANRWYRVVYTISAYAAGAVAIISGIGFTSSRAANGTYTETLRSTGTNFAIRGTSAFTGSIDNVSAKMLTTAELISSVLVATADVIAEVALTLTSGLTAGLVVNLDNAANPQNFIVCHINSDGILYLDEVVAGVFTNKIATAITYSAGAILRLVRDGTQCRVFYNGAVVGTLQTMTANTNTRHGLFSTSPNNSLDNFTVWARGKNNEYSILDSY